jgi:hypothetical protein
VHPPTLRPSARLRHCPARHSILFLNVTVAAPRLKGTNLVHTRHYVEASFGLEGWATVAAGMTPESRAAVNSVVAVGWYPATLHVDLLHAIDSELDQKKGALVLRAAQYGAEYDFTRIHRVLFRLANPGFLLERVGGIWTRFFDSGRWSVERPSPTSTEATLADFGIVDATYCAYLGAYFVRLFELVGARDVTLGHSVCRARGHAVCRYDGAWR